MADARKAVGPQVFIENFFLVWFFEPHVVHQWASGATPTAHEVGAVPRDVCRLNMWLLHILRYTRLPSETTELALLLMYRLPQPLLDPVKGLIPFQNAVIGSLIAADKYLQDRPYKNETWATVSGMLLTEINRLEIEFLRQIRYRLWVGGRDWTLWRLFLRRLQPVIWSFFT